MSSASDSTRSVFVKQAPEFIKCLGPEAKLSSQRAVLESAALVMLNSLAPACTPRHLHFDEGRAAIVMEDLREHVMLRDELLAGRAFAADAKCLGTFMARIHAQTMASSGRPEGSTSRAARFTNELLSGITSAYVFLKPFDPAEPSNRHSAAVDAQVAALRNPGSRAMQAAAELEEVFRSRKQCLIHGDLHSGSVMVARSAPTAGAAPPPEPQASAYTEGGRLRVIDAEFACEGPAAFDVGLALAAYAFAHFHHGAHARADTVEAVERAVRALWSEYAAQMGTLLSAAPEGAGAMESPQHLPTVLLPEILREATGFMGAELTRRVIGAAHVADLDGIGDEVMRASAERAALACGACSLECWRQVGSIDDVIGYMRGTLQQC